MSTIFLIHASNIQKHINKDVNKDNVHIIIIGLINQ